MRALQLQRRLGRRPRTAAGVRAGAAVAAVAAAHRASRLRDHLRGGGTHPHIPHSEGEWPHGAAVPARARLHVLLALARRKAVHWTLSTRLDLLHARQLGLRRCFEQSSSFGMR
eukprot:scaffold63134_cov63-Phaeocystis_antarctica.AAC.4